MNRIQFRRRRLLEAAWLDVKLTGRLDRSTRIIAKSISKDRQDESKNQ